MLLLQPYGFDWSFVALEPTGLAGGRAYKIFVGDRLLCGAVVGRSPILAALAPRSNDRWSDPDAYAGPRQLARYVGMNVTSPYFLRAARHNFHLHRPRLVAVEFDPRPCLRLAALPQSGRLRLRFSDGFIRRFILPGLQDGVGIADALRPARPER